MKFLAQLYNPVLPGTLGGGTTPDKAVGALAAGKLVSALIGVIFLFSFLLALFTLITGGLQWIASNGDKAGLEAARDKITNALLGLIIVAAAWAIMVLVGNFFGLNLAPDMIKLPIPSFDSIP